MIATIVEATAGTDPHWSEVGIGGLLALLVLREVFRFVSRFLKERRGDDAVEKRRDELAGEKSVEYWKIEIKDAVSQAMSEQMMPILEQQTEILKQIASTESKQSETLQRLAYIAESQERMAAARAAAAGQGGG